MRLGCDNDSSVRTPLVSDIVRTISASGNGEDGNNACRTNTRVCLRTQRMKHDRFAVPH